MYSQFRFDSEIQFPNVAGLIMQLEVRSFMMMMDIIKLGEIKQVGYERHTFEYPYPRHSIGNPVMSVNVNIECLKS